VARTAGPNREERTGEEKGDEELGRARWLVRRTLPLNCWFRASAEKKVSSFARGPSAVAGAT
jgi:hypothetical protein